MGRMIHIVFTIICLVLILAGGLLTGLAIHNTSPRNDIMFWIGINCFIFAGLAVVSWIIYGLHSEKISCCAGFKDALFHAIMCQIGLIFMIAGAVNISYGQSIDTLVHYWVGIGFMCAWAVLWIIWISISCYWYCSCNK